MKAPVNPGGEHGGAGRGSSTCDLCLIFGSSEQEKWLPYKITAINPEARRVFLVSVWIVNDQLYLQSLISELVFEGILCRILDVGLIGNAH